MKPMNSNRLGIDLDLAFHGFLYENIPVEISKEIRNLLIHSDFWSENLKKWLAFVKSKKILFCPEIVLKSTAFSIGLEFTDDYNISLINQKWRHKNISTDVLSFPMIDEDMNQLAHPIVELGDIIISVPTAYKQANQHHHSLLKELTWLLSHGFLHLLGWEHRNAKALKEMLDFQDQLLEVTSELIVNSSRELKHS